LAENSSLETTPKTNTVQRLLDAAMAEFCEFGFDGTDSNKIARRAGFAPQTFYRWFKDKREIFLTLFQNWIDALYAYDHLAAPLSDAERIEIGIEIHRRYARFRESLRMLARDDDEIRQARTRSRRGQLAFVRGWLAPLVVDDADILLFCLEHERLCEAVASGELTDLGLSDDAARGRLHRLYGELRGQHREA